MVRPGNERVYEFGSFRLDASERRLMNGEQSVRLTARLFDLLLLLVEKSGRIVTKDELIGGVWPNSFVEENNLTVSMSALRKALSDSPGEHTYIETVPKHGYRFVASVREVAEGQCEVAGERFGESSAAHGDARAGEMINSLAVLPLENTGRDPALDYLADGITESIINILSQLPLLKVMARSTVFRYKSGGVDPLAAGRETGVRYLMTGRVLQLGDRLIIRAELVDVESGLQLWGEQYQRRPSDILALQGEIARDVSEKLQFRLTERERKSLARRYTENLEAYHLYLKGRFFWNKHTKEGALKGIDYFRRAIELDPNYAMAYAGLADSYHRLSNIYLPPDEVLPLAKEAAFKALEIDDTLAEAHSSLGLVKVYYDHDWAGAEREYRRAVELNPRSALFHQRYGSYLMYMTRFEEARARLQLALELDPLSLQLNVIIGTNLYAMRLYDEATAQLRKTIELDPNYYPGYYTLGMVYTEQGKYGEALELFERVCCLEKNSHMFLGPIGRIHALSGDRKKAAAILRRLKHAASSEYVSPYSAALIHVGLQEKEKAMQCLEMMYREHNDWLVWLNAAPEFDRLRTEPKFRDLMRRLGVMA